MEQLLYPYFFFLCPSAYCDKRIDNWRIQYRDDEFENVLTENHSDEYAQWHRAVKSNCDENSRIDKLTGHRR